MREVRLYDRLFKSETPGDAGDYRADLNPASLEVVAGCKIEPSAAAAPPGDALSVRTAGLLLRRSRLAAGLPVFNRTVSLKDSWARMAAAEASR